MIAEKNSISSRTRVAILLLLLLVEAALYSGSFSKFFNGDSLFYFSRRLSTPWEAFQRLISVDDIKQYRPLTHIIFSFFLYPFFKLNSFGYHFIPLAFHMANTLIVYLFLRKIIEKELASLVGAFFFGIHSVSFSVTYDIGFLSDFTYAMFYLLSILAMIKHIELERKAFFWGSILSYVLCLLSKEAAVTLPFNLLLSVILLARSLCPWEVERGMKIENWTKLKRDISWGIKRVSPFFLILILYLFFLYMTRGGEFLPKEPTHFHYMDFKLNILFKNLKFYSIYVFNFCVELFFIPRNFLKLLILVGLSQFVLLLVSYIIYLIYCKNRYVIFGLIWFLIALLPVLFFVHNPEKHCLYIPVIGIALIVGLSVNSAFHFVKHYRPKLAKVSLIFFLVFSLLVSIYDSRIDSYFLWYKKTSNVVKNCLEDIKRAHPVLNKNSVLYFMKTGDTYFPLIIDSGKLFNVFYGDGSIKTLFGDWKHHKLPPNYFTDENVFILVHFNDHVYDITKEHKEEQMDRNSYKLLNHIKESKVTFNYDQFLSYYQNRPTPPWNPVSIYPLVKENTFRYSLAMFPGTSVSFPIPPVEKGWVLKVGVARAFDTKVGMEGFIYFEYDGKRDLLFSKVIDSTPIPQHRKWSDEVIDLSKYAGKRGRLVFECETIQKAALYGQMWGWSILRISPNSR